MAFSRYHLAPVAVVLEKQTFMYSTDEDTTAEVLTSGYFDETVDERTAKASILRQGSMIIVGGSDFTTQTVIVTSETGATPVTVI